MTSSWNSRTDDSLSLGSTFEHLYTPVRFEIKIWWLHGNQLVMEWIYARRIRKRFYIGLAGPHVTIFHLQKSKCFRAPSMGMPTCRKKVCIVLHSQKKRNICSFSKNTKPDGGWLVFPLEVKFSVLLCLQRNNRPPGYEAIHKMSVRITWRKWNNYRKNSDFNTL